MNISYQSIVAFIAMRALRVDILPDLLFALT